MGVDHRPVRAAIGAGLAYAVLSVVATWPLLLHLTSHVPGSNVDEGAFLWNLWWVRFSLLDLHQSPFFTSYLFYPVGVNLATYTLTTMNGLLSIPLQLAAGPIVAANLIFLASLMLSGLGAYLLVRDVLHDSGASGPAVEAGAFLGGLVFAFPASRFIYAALGQMNFASTAWIPFFALFFLRTLRALRPGAAGRPPLGNALLAGLCFAGAALTELTYAVFLALFALPFIAGELFVWWRGLRGGQVHVSTVGKLLTAVLIVVLAAGLPLLTVVPRYLADQQIAQSSWGEADRFSADLLSLFTPTRLSPLFGGLSRAWSADFKDIPIEFLGWTTAALALLGAIVRFRRARVWIFTALMFLLLSLGPLLTINGQNQFDLDGLLVRAPLPFLALHYVPVVGANRVPNRFSIMVMLALGVLAGLGVRWLIGRLGGRTIPAVVTAVALGLLVFGEHFSAPLPLVNAAPPDGYQVVASEPGDFSVLQLPLGWRNSYGTQGLERTIVQSYQSVHEKRLFGGNTSRNPQSTFAYFQRVPLFHSLIQLEEGKPLDPGAAERDRATAPLLADLYDLRYLAVYRPLTPPGVEDYARTALAAEKVQETADLAIYRVPRPAPPDVRTYVPGTPTAGGVLGAGWGVDEKGAGDVPLVWATSKDADLYLPPRTSAGTLRLRLLPFVYAGMPEQRVTISVNGREVEQRALAPDWNDVEVTVPASAWHDTTNRVTLTFAGIASPSQVMSSTDTRMLAAALARVEIENE